MFQILPIFQTPIVDYWRSIKIKKPIHFINRLLYLLVAFFLTSFVKLLQSSTLNPRISFTELANYSISDKVCIASIKLAISEGLDLVILLPNHLF